MLKIALCDDNELQVDILQEFFYDFNSVSPYRVDVSAFTSGPELLDAMAENGRFDIYILDIVMPNMDGLELAKRIRETDATGKIVFLSSETSFVYRAFSVDASGYLVKPVNPEELFGLINTLRIKIEKEQPPFILIQTEAGTRRVEVKDILYVDTVDREPLYHLSDGTEIMAKTKRARFQELVSDLLNGYPFVLSSVGVAVNLANVESVNPEAGEILLKGGRTVFCSRTMRDNLTNRLKELWNT